MTAPTRPYWFDGLDVPLVHLLEPMYVEGHPDGMEPVKRVVTDSPLPFPDGAHAQGTGGRGAGPGGPFRAGASATRRRKCRPSPSPCTAWTAASGGRPYRCTANSAFVVMQGSGRSVIDGTTIDWSYGDTFVSPSWKTARHSAADDAVLFQMSDEDLIRWGAFLWRFEAMD